MADPAVSKPMTRSVGGRGGDGSTPTGWIEAVLLSVARRDTRPSSAVNSSCREAADAWNLRRQSRGEPRPSDRSACVVNDGTAKPDHDEAPRPSGQTMHRDHYPGMPAIGYDGGMRVLLAVVIVLLTARALAAQPAAPPVAATPHPEPPHPKPPHPEPAHPEPAHPKPAHLRAIRPVGAGPGGGGANRRSAGGEVDHVAAHADPERRRRHRDRGLRSAEPRLAAAHPAGAPPSGGDRRRPRQRHRRRVVHREAADPLPRERSRFAALRRRAWPISAAASRPALWRERPGCRRFPTPPPRRRSSVASRC